MGFLVRPARSLIGWKRHGQHQFENHLMWDVSSHWPSSLYSIDYTARAEFGPNDHREDAPHFRKNFEQIGVSVI